MSVRADCELYPQLLFRNISPVVRNGNFIEMRHQIGQSTGQCFASHWSAMSCCSNLRLQRLQDTN